LTVSPAVNVTSADAWKAGVEQVVQTFGGLNFVINNAGGWWCNFCLGRTVRAYTKPVLETTEADFDKCINLNLRSIYHSVIACMPSLIAATEKGLPASMVNIASTGGVKGRPGLTWYSASKAGAINATQSLAHEFAGQQIVSEHGMARIDADLEPDRDLLQCSASIAFAPSLARLR
jgi:NAD(P)-dependent dehydrogenase (short-subunit alcohol dehydrogenase family)